MAKVIIRELLEIEVEVNSVDANDVIAQVESLYKNSRVILTSENLKQTEFIINNIIKKQISYDYPWQLHQKQRKER